MHTSVAGLGTAENESSIVLSAVRRLPVYLESPLV
jgi:hypothetical protein